MLQRDAFLAALLQQFAGRTEIGDGELFRTLRELQASTSGRPRRPSSSQIPSDGECLELRGDPHLCCVTSTSVALSWSPLSPDARGSGGRRAASSGSQPRFV